ncbi:hypothetical protein DFJ58DRAFT_179963 [Suillus subalutaceus]|uniref:uncharacterized protein n=1 Tax=Suillus subalutaceus TaxID=48586 RepID=UPI001B883478|nr:uncharacterized protein DFJ58DRAFT_179963 [Suillus subalutaceus]KAG1876555.1 hypothetical protein DFJ58DRAFT_179963 [Suillus subalutaceus]
MMTDAPPSNAFPDLCSPDDHSQSDIVRGNMSFEEQQQQQMSRASYSLTPQMNQMDTYDYAGPVELPGQLQFGFSVPRIDTKALGSMTPPTPSYSLVPDGRLRVHAPPGTPLSNIQYHTFSPSNSKGLSPIPSPMSPNSPAVMGSSDEGSFLQAFDDDEDDAPQPMEHVVKWKAIRDQAIVATGTTVYIPQSIYQPYTEADRVRYIEKADLKEPIIFKTAHPGQWGIALEDACRAKMQDLLDKDDNMLEDCGPSVSIRLQWPGYRAWTKQIPTMDFKSPKGPITRAKLAKNIAHCVKRFIDEKENERMKMEADRRWRVGARHIRVEDLILVSLHHISKDSWQPQLRLRTPLSEIQLRRLQPPAPHSVA